MTADALVLALFAVLPLLLLAALLSLFRRRPASGGRRRLRLVIGNALLLLLLCSLLLLGGELYYRFLDEATDSFGLTKVMDEWKKRYVVTNELGVRDERGHANAARAPGKRRLTFVGDSFTEGHGLKNVDDRFVNLIRSGRPDWEVHTFARGGMDTGEELEVLQRRVEIAHYEVDVVVLVYCLNDIADIVPEWQTIQRRIHRGAKPSFLIQHSFFLNKLYYRWRAAEEPAISRYFEFVGSAYEGPLWEEQRTRLMALQRLVAAHSGRLVVVTFPFLHSLGEQYAFAGVHQRLGEFWRERGVPHLDLLPLFRAHTSEELVVNRHDAHPNERAHAMAAQAIRSFVEPHVGAPETPRASP